MPLSIPIDRVTLLCFGASYLVAWLSEFLHTLRHRRVYRYLALGFVGAGLLAQTLFLAVQNPPLSSQYGTLLFLAWILAVFALYGSFHYRRVAWGLFVLPVLLALIGLAALLGKPEADAQGIWLIGLVGGERFWGSLHGSLLLLAAVGICVGFVASVMYLWQSARLRAKTLPTRGLPLLSLERLEEMNRRAINLAFPLLTAGLLTGLGLLFQEAHRIVGWHDPRVLTTFVLWLVFAILLYLRHAAYVRGKRLAVLTIIAFLCLLLTLAVPHTLGQGVTP